VLSVWLAVLTANVEAVPQGAPLPFPLVGTEWAIGKTVPQIKRIVTTPGMFRRAVMPNDGRFGYIDYVSKVCTISFFLRPAAQGGDPIVENVLPQGTNGKPISGKRVAECLRTIRRR
jgi:hypothetical protein